MTNNVCGQMSVPKLLKIRGELLGLNEQIKKICEREWKKGNYCFIEFYGIDNNPLEECVEKLDALGDYEQTFYNVGDTIMACLYNENVEEDFDDQLKSDSEFINRSVRNLMIKYHLYRTEDKLKWGLP